MAEQALRSDPKCQKALAILALGCQWRADYQPFMEAADLDTALAAARHLHELDSNNHAAWLVLGVVAIRRHDHDKALACLRRGHTLNPNDVDMLRFLSWEESNWALADEGRVHAMRALQLSPRDPALDRTYWMLAFAAYVAGDLETAIGYGRHRRLLNPANVQRDGILAASLAEHGDVEEARVLLQDAYQHKPDYVVSRLRGMNYFAVPELGARYVAALRKAAGDLTVLWGIDRGSSGSR